LKFDKSSHNVKKLDEPPFIKEFNANLNKDFDKKARAIANAELSLLLPKYKKCRPNSVRQLRQTT